MTTLDEAVNKRDKAEQELEQIIKLAKELHRLQGKPAFEWLEQDLEMLIQGKG